MTDKCVREGFVEADDRLLKVGRKYEGYECTQNKMADIKCLGTYRVISNDDRDRVDPSIRFQHSGDHGYPSEVLSYAYNFSGKIYYGTNSDKLYVREAPDCIPPTESKHWTYPNRAPIAPPATAATANSDAEHARRLAAAIANSDAEYATRLAAAKGHVEDLQARDDIINSLIKQQTQKPGSPPETYKIGKNEYIIIVAPPPIGKEGVRVKINLPKLPNTNREYTYFTKKAIGPAVPYKDGEFKHGGDYYTVMLAPIYTSIYIAPDGRRFIGSQTPAFGQPAYMFNQYGPVYYVRSQLGGKRRRITKRKGNRRRARRTRLAKK